MVLRSIALLPLGLLALQGCSGAPEAKRANAPDAFMQIDQQNFPEMYQRLGEDAFSRANSRSQTAINLISKRASCDGVELAGVSDTSTRSNVAWYAYCFNGSKEIVSERDF